jgi:hypothetical protein
MPHPLQRVFEMSPIAAMGLLLLISFATVIDFALSERRWRDWDTNKGRQGRFI